MSEKKQSTEAELAGFGIAMAFAVFIGITVVPILLISLPMAIVIKTSLEESFSLKRLGFILVICGIFYFFFLGVNENFVGIGIYFFEDHWFEFVAWLKNLIPRQFRAVRDILDYLDYPRIFFWTSYLISIVVAFIMIALNGRDKKSMREFFERSEENESFEKILSALVFFILPYYLSAKALVLISNRLFTDKLRAKIFIFTGIVLTYLVVYLIFGDPYSWHVQYGYLINKFTIVIKTLGVSFFEVMKWYFYQGALLAPFVLLARSSDFELDIREVQEVSHKKTNNTGDGVYLGVDQKSNPLYLDSKTLNHHVHVVGASGFGKTTFLLNIIKGKIEAGESLIFVDLKGDIDTVCEFASFLRDANRLSDFEFFSISEDFLNVSSGISLFKNGNAVEIKDKIMGAFRYDHDYYKKRVESFLNLVLRALVYLRDNKGESFDFDSIYRLTQGFEGLEELSNKIDLPEIKSDLESLIRDKKLKEDLTGLRADIEGVVKTEFGHLLSGGIDLYESMRDKKIVYIHLDSQRYEASAEKLGRLILQEMKTASAKIVTSHSKQNRDPVTLIVDEFANLATDQFVGFLNKARASGIGIVIGHQELSDLDAFSPTVKDQVMTNTSTLFSFLQKLPKSAEMIAGIGGTYQTIKETNQFEESGVIFKSKADTGLGTTREVEEYIVHPNFIKELEVGECFMISKYPRTRIAKCFVNRINTHAMSKKDLIEVLKYNQKIEVKRSAEKTDKDLNSDEDWL